MARILIIDDDDPFRTQLRPLVEAWDGREGIRAYRAAPTDLVITDIIMPEQEGLETVRALRQEFPTITIVAMTGSRLFALDLLEMARLMGANRTLAKPPDWQLGQALEWPDLQHTMQELLAAR